MTTFHHPERHEIERILREARVLRAAALADIGRRLVGAVRIFAAALSEGVHQAREARRGQPTRPAV
jgi:hypothetical protein